jgi:hypothetical protein
MADTSRRALLPNSGSSSKRKVTKKGDVVSYLAGAGVTSGSLYSEAKYDIFAFRSASANRSHQIGFVHQAQVAALQKQVTEQFTEMRVRFSEHRAKVRELTSLLPGWDGGLASIPNTVAVRNAEKVLDAISSSSMLQPHRIVPSVEGGIAVTFRAGSTRYADIECFNDGELMATTSSKDGDTAVWEFTMENFNQTLRKINAFLCG